MMIWMEIESAMLTTTLAVRMVEQEFALVVNQDTHAGCRNKATSRHSGCCCFLMEICLEILHKERRKAVCHVRGNGMVQFFSFGLSRLGNRGVCVLCVVAPRMFHVSVWPFSSFVPDCTTETPKILFSRTYLATD
jgi:hypothetical protein